MPETYSMPLSKERRDELKLAIKVGRENGTASYISKPSNSSRGRGIVFITEPQQVCSLSSEYF